MKAYSLRMKVVYLDMFATERATVVEHAKLASRFARHHKIKEHTFRNWVRLEAQLREVGEGPPKASCMLRRHRQFQGRVS